MAAFEATGERSYLDKAERIADLIIRRSAGAQRLAGARALSRRLERRPRLQGLRHVPPLRRDARPRARMDAAVAAIVGARRPPPRLAAGGGRARCSPARSTRAGTRRAAASTTRSNGAARRGCATGCGGRSAKASARRPSSARSAAARTVEAWYRRLWDFAARHFIDRRNGGWLPQLDDSLRPIDGYFVGKPDLYHALQACLIPLYPTDGSVTSGILAEAQSLP